MGTLYPALSLGSERRLHHSLVTSRSYIGAESKGIKLQNLSDYEQLRFGFRDESIRRALGGFPETNH